MQKSTKLIGSQDFRMPPVRISDLEELGTRFLEVFAPSVLSQPSPLNVLELVDSVLPSQGLKFYSASEVELAEEFGATDFSGPPDSEIIILLREQLFDDLEAPAPRSHFARVTAIHEASHGILHVPVLRRRIAAGHHLQRLDARVLKVYEQSEWQAFCLAGTILAPRATIAMVEKPTVRKLSDIYEVSTDFMVRHLRRLKLEVPFK